MSLIEHYGVEIISETDRASCPGDVISILIGSNLCVSFGLSWWAATSSLIVGTLVGAGLTAPLALFIQYRHYLSTSSGATFGVRGRLIGFTP